MSLDESLPELRRVDQMLKELIPGLESYRGELCAGLLVVEILKLAAVADNIDSILRDVRAYYERGAAA